jgi:hypothetical protein
MRNVDADLDRLLRAAAASPEAAPIETPFGFETRVVATWRALRSRNGNGRALTWMLRRVVAGALLLTLCAGAGAYWQFSENSELAEPTANAYAIADTLIEAGTVP